MSYTLKTLKQAIKDYTSVDETTFNSNINNFIKMTEERLLKNVQMSVFKKEAAISIVSANEIEFPTDYLATLNFSIRQTSNDVTTDIFLEQKDYAFVVYNDASTTATGTPKYYAIISSSDTGADSHFPVTTVRVSPKANGTYTGKLIYLYRPKSLVDTSSTAAYAGTSTVGTTWLSTNAPRAMLYGCLSEAYTFLKGEPDLLALYEKQFQESAIGLKNLGESKEVQDDFRIGGVVRAKE